MLRSIRSFSSCAWKPLLETPCAPHLLVVSKQQDPFLPSPAPAQSTTSALYTAEAQAGGHPSRRQDTALPRSCHTEVAAAGRGAWAGCLAVEPRTATVLGTDATHKHTHTHQDCHNSQPLQTRLLSSLLATRPRNSQAQSADLSGFQS